MGNEIGTVNINLRMSLAAFKQDMKDGAEAATRGSKQLADTLRENSREGAAALGLIGEEIGIAIPRHVRSFVASLPGVGSALAAAFNSVAIIALISVIGELVSRIVEFQQHAREVSEAWEKVGDEGKEALHKIDLSLLETQKRLDELRNDHVAVLRDSIALIDAQSLDQIGSEFQKLGKSASDAFEKMKVGAFWNAVGAGNNNGIQRVKDQFEEVLNTVKRLREEGRNDDIGKVLQGAVTQAKEAIATFDKWGGTSKDVRQAWVSALEVLEQMKEVYTKIDETAKQKNQAESMQSAAKATQEATQRAKELQGMLDKINEGLSKMRSGRSTLPPDLGNVNVDPTGVLNAETQIGRGPTPAKPVYGGTKEAEELYKIQTDQNEAVKEAQKIYTETRTASEQYSDKIAELNALLAQRRLDQDTYNRAIAQAKEKLDGTSASWQKFGVDIGETLKQSALFGRSWSDALESISIELAQLILKLTVFKNLSAASSSGGTGLSGFLSGLFGGFKAEGGPLQTGKWYVAGEHGPEPIWGGGAGAFAGGYPKAAPSAGGKSLVQNFHMNVHGVTDKDSFQKSKGQIAADMFQIMGAAHRRNR